MTGSPHETIRTPEVIEANLLEAAGQIRDFTASQVEEWQQIPLLALRGDSNPYSTSRLNSMTYDSKIWRYGVVQVVGDPSTLSGTFVDCENGKLITMLEELDLNRKALDEDVIEAWYSLRGLVASRYLEHYKKLAEHGSVFFENRRGVPSLGETDDEHSRNRAKERELERTEEIANIAERLGITAVYSRQPAASS